MYPEALLNPHINSNKFSEDYFRFSIHVTISFAKDDSIISTFPIIIPLVLFFPHLQRQRPPTVLNRSGNIRHSLIMNLKEKNLNISLLHILFHYDTSEGLSQTKDDPFHSYSVKRHYHEWKLNCMKHIFCFD